MLITDSLLLYVAVEVYMGQTDRQTESVMVGGRAVDELWLC